MPGYRAHLATAVLVYGLVALVTWAWYQEYLVRIVGFCAVCAGALFPDIDIKSKGQHYLYRLYAGALMGAIGMYIFYRTALWTDIIICLAIMSVAPMLARHRGITHNPRFILLLGICFWILGAGFYPQSAHNIFFYCTCFILGALSHVWLDRRRIFF